jgi:hypothetical protein
MKNYVATFVLFVFAQYLPVGTVMAQDCPPGKLCIPEIPPTPIQRSYQLTVTSVSPGGVLLEHQPISVTYALTVTQFGFRGQLEPLAASVCPAGDKGVCVSIPNVNPGSYRGTIQTFAPAAGQSAPIKIRLVQTFSPACLQTPGCVLAESDALPTPVAAQYDVTVDSFASLRTRAKTYDTVKISLRSRLLSDSDLCTVATGNYCANLVPQGDHGGNPPNARSENVTQVQNVRVGSFKLVPEVDDHLTFEYDVWNLGVSYSQGATTVFLNSMSQLAAGILDALKVTTGSTSTGSGGSTSTSTGTGTFDTLNTWAQTVNGLDQCDGIVAGGAVIIYNKSKPTEPGFRTLDVVTRDTGRYSPGPTRFDGTTSGVGCGENSLYDVTWSVIRTSWQQ